VDCQLHEVRVLSTVVAHSLGQSDVVAEPRTQVVVGPSHHARRRTGVVPVLVAVFQSQPLVRRHSLSITQTTQRASRVAIGRIVVVVGPRCPVAADVFVAVFQSQPLVRRHSLPYIQGGAE